MSDTAAPLATDDHPDAHPAASTAGRTGDGAAPRDGLREDPARADGVPDAAPPPPVRVELRIHLVRHGRTRFNDELRLQGWTDSELTAHGLHGIRAAAAALADVPFVGARSSDSPRAVTTARMLLEPHPGVGLREDPRLRELNFGDLEAEPETVLATQVDGRELFRGVFEGTHPGLPNGESGRRFLARVAQGYRAVERDFADGGDVLVVSHGLTLLALLTMLSDVPARPLPNVGISTVRVTPDGRRELERVGWSALGETGAAPDGEMRLARVALADAEGWGEDA
ncbi:histidine phosphatase family protein [Cellulomonas endophytica]|uniref:histidine phosphatase family protein n=1 Tax=Cellulomonas endophytica TaxID=2494735 RepID=UPI0010113E12|nr:histidine phosphatase family protein [Cellulomonas endophytica]